MTWDPGEYLRFGEERARPFNDLMAHVEVSDPAYVVDLGCGPGSLTRTLARRWPAAEVVGVDNSAEMIERAERDAASDRVRFIRADLRTWQPRRPVDVLTCNAALQWVPGHVELLPRFVAMLSPEGWFAFQVPGNFGEPSHTELGALVGSPRWRAVLERRELPVPAVEEPEVYLDLLASAGCRVDAWETTYYQVLEGDDAVLRWMAGTALRAVLSVLSEEEREEFAAEYGARLRQAYPRRPYGTVLPYRRIFVVCRTQRSLAGP